LISSLIQAGRVTRLARLSFSHFGASVSADRGAAGKTRLLESNGTRVVKDFVTIQTARQKARPIRLKRFATTLMAACAVLAFAGAAQCDPSKPASEQDGKYFDAEGTPTYNISADGKVDWPTYSGFQRYNAECLRCHGPDGMGSSYAPALIESLKKMDYATFLATVAQGRKNLAGGQEKVMPMLGEDKNVMCYIDDIYIYLKARSDDALGRNRPPSHDAKSKSWQAAQDSCMGAS
jgi:methanol metabolism-related c-type cytochrome